MSVRSLNEYWVRGNQETSMFLERTFGMHCAEMTDAQLSKELKQVGKTGSAEQIAGAILNRIAVSISPLSQLSQARKAIPAILEGRFPRAAKEIIERADRICAYQFDLLGLTDLHFGCPIDWHLEPVSGRRTSKNHWSRIEYLNPQVAGDKKVTWELHRHQFFVTLGQAYCLTGDERYTEAFMAQIWSWMEANPPKQGIAWASSLELAFRVISWIWALHLFASSSRLSAEIAHRMLKYLVAQGRHIETYLSHYFSPNTHLTGEALGLFYLGSAFPELRVAERWKTLGLTILLQQLPKHVQQDGVYFEQTSYYHRYTTDFYLHLCLLAQAQCITLPPLVVDKLQLLLDHLMWITRPDGTSPCFGDDDGGILVPLGVRPRNDFRDTLAIGAVLFRRPEWKHVAGQDCPELLWLLGPSAVDAYDALSAIPLRETSKAFDRGGYFVMRSDWSEQARYLLVDCGPHGVMNCGHAHADALSFEFAAGASWVVDPGTCTYTGDAEQRNYFRSTHAHNAITVDGLSQSVPLGPFSWRSTGSSQVDAFTETERWASITGQHDGYHRLADPVTHFRTVALRKSNSVKDERDSYVVIYDRMVAEKGHRYASRLHLASTCQAVAEAFYARLTMNTGQTMGVFTAVSDCHGVAIIPRVHIEDGWISPCYGQRLSASTFVSEWETVGMCHCVTVLVPVQGQAVEPAIDWIASDIERSTEQLGIPPAIARVFRQFVPTCNANAGGHLLCTTDQGESLS